MRPVCVCVCLRNVKHRCVYLCVFVFVYKYDLIYSKHNVYEVVSIMYVYIGVYLEMCIMFMCVHVYKWQTRKPKKK